MNAIIILDTNIYRQLGRGFYDHIDYKSLIEYSYASGATFLMPQTVLEEYLDYYQCEVIDRNLLEISKAYERLQKLAKFRKVKAPDFKKRAQWELNFIEGKLTEHHVLADDNGLLNEKDLLRFLLVNKQVGRKDNTRDYLIWLNAIAAAKADLEAQVMLISDDKIFTENDFFQQMKKEYEIANLEVYRSIPAFLSIYGFRSPALTAELILANIPGGMIQAELLSGKDDIPRYISHFYDYRERDFKLEDLSVGEKRVEAFYAHKDPKSDEAEIIAQIEVKIRAVFDPEPHLEELQQYLEYNRVKHPYDLDTFDAEGRPVYDEEMSLLFALTFSESKQQITSVEFLTFFPEDYQVRKMRKLSSGNRLA